MEANGPHCIFSPMLLEVDRSADHVVAKGGPVSDHTVMEAGPLPLPFTTTGAPSAVAPSSCASAIKAPTGLELQMQVPDPRTCPSIRSMPTFRLRGHRCPLYGGAFAVAKALRLWVKGGSPLSSTCSPSAGSRRWTWSPPNVFFTGVLTTPARLCTSSAWCRTRSSTT